MRLLELDDTALGAFTLDDGERGVLLGRSGAGKTVVIKRMLGLGGPVSKRRGSPLAERCAYVPQTDGVFLDLTALENVARPIAGLRNPSIERALNWLDLVGMTRFSELPVHQLNSAERRRIALARALSRERPLLIVDGPLDPIITQMLPDLLATVPHVCSVLTTSCEADAAVWESDRVGVVEGCRILASGTMADVTEDRDPDVRAALSWTMP